MKTRLVYLSSGIVAAGALATTLPRLVGSASSSVVAPQARAVVAPQTPATPAPPPAPPDKVAPNELGRFPILMYHSVGDRGGYDRHGLNISPETFRRHLKMLHEAGFYPVNMRDALSPSMNVPRGWTPVVLTFDDARASQFRYTKSGAIDPNCALGILEEAHKKWGTAWPQRGVFYVLPESKYNPSPFGQAKTITQKFNYLVKSGYELANHSTSHHAMNRMDATRLSWEMRTCREYVQKRTPQATMDTVACPYGIYPRSEALLDVLVKEGNRCVLMAWGDASYAPLDKRFDTRRVMRVGSEPGNIERWIAALKRARNKPDASLAPYISDGDTQTVTIPAAKKKFVANARLNGLHLAVLPGPKTKQPVVRQAKSNKTVSAR